jgi:hypothetical protein
MSISKLDKAKYKTIIDKSEMLINEIIMNSKSNIYQESLLIFFLKKYEMANYNLNSSTMISI